MNRRHIKRDHLGNEIHDVMVDVTWEQVRRLRDERLQDSDWRAVKDRTMSQAWKDFRTSLRDLPQEHESANDAADAFPEAPA